MIKSFLRSINNTRAIPKGLTHNNLTIYHKTSSETSSQLLDRLLAYSKMPCTLNKFHDATNLQFKQYKTTQSKFLLNVEINKALSYNDYKFILNHCMDIHPDNKDILQQILKLNHTYDVEVLNKEFFEELIQNDSAKGPLIIDYSNNLIANDSKSFDRVMANYLSCGIQNPYTNSAPSWGPNLANKSNEVHPHVAEFADLF